MKTMNLQFYCCLLSRASLLFSICLGSYFSASAADSADSDRYPKQPFQNNSLILIENEISNEYIDPAFLDLGATPVFLTYWLNWTHCQIHLSGYNEPVELLLPGSINSNKPEILRMFVADPHPGGVPNLYYIRDILENPPPVETSMNIDIPLQWEISLDNGPFKPITLLPDNSLTTIFPPGQHDFQIKITCLLQPNQTNGYYHLQLNQILVPQL